MVSGEGPRDEPSGIGVVLKSLLRLPTLSVRLMGSGDARPRTASDRLDGGLGNAGPVKALVGVPPLLVVAPLLASELDDSAGALSLNKSLNAAYRSQEGTLLDAEGCDAGSPWPSGL